MTSSVIVAEKSRVCRLTGQSRMISFISSIKCSSNILMDKQQIQWMNNKYNGHLLNKWSMDQCSVNGQTSNPYTANMDSCINQDWFSHQNQFGNETVYLSASSNTNISTVCKLKEGVLCKWSTKRPGVATTMSGLRLKAASWPLLSNPPDNME